MAIPPPGRKPVVYIASAYTKGDPATNVYFQCKVFDDLMSNGLVIPYAPLWCYFQHIAHPRPHTDWVDYDNAMIRQACDACLRLDAVDNRTQYFQRESRGADAEVRLFLELERPVFYCVEAMYQWAIEILAGHEPEPYAKAAGLQNQD